MDDFDEVFDSFDDFARNNPLPNEDGEEVDNYDFKTAIATLEEIRKTKKDATDFDVFEKNMLGRHAERFDHILTVMNNRDFVSAYLSALPYIKPKLKSVEQKAEKTNRKLTVEYHLGGKKI